MAVSDLACAVPSHLLGPRKTFQDAPDPAVSQSLCLSFLLLLLLHNLSFAMPSTFPFPAFGVVLTAACGIRLSGRVHFQRGLWLIPRTGMSLFTGFLL